MYAESHHHQAQSAINSHVCRAFAVSDKEHLQTQPPETSLTKERI